MTLTWPSVKVHVWHCHQYGGKQNLSDTLWEVNNGIEVEQWSTASNSKILWTQILTAFHSGDSSTVLSRMHLWKCTFIYETAEQFKDFEKNVRNCQKVVFFVTMNCHCMVCNNKFEAIVWQLLIFHFKCAELCSAVCTAQTKGIMYKWFIFNTWMYGGMKRTISTFKPTT